MQTLDFFTPIVNDPYRFGQIAAANALSDVYAMGGTPWCAMNIVCFPIKEMPRSVLQDIIHGGYDKIREAGAVLAGGHSVEDAEIKYGLSVTGYVEPGKHTANSGLRPGDQLILTKPLGTGVLATAVKANWDGRQRFEDELYRWAGHLNNNAGAVITAMSIAAATDVTGFGLGGHLIEMARASNVSVTVWTDSVPILDNALELASYGLIPAGSYANKHFCDSLVFIAPDIDTLRADLIFDAQTSGGLVLGVPEERLGEAMERLQDLGEMAAHIGSVAEHAPESTFLHLVSSS